MGLSTVTFTKHFFLAAAAHTLLLHGAVSAAPSPDGDPKLRSTVEACKLTSYRQLCVQTLALFSEGSRSIPYLWARAGVVVTIWEVGSLSRYLDQVKNSGKVRGRRLISAFNDCVDFTDNAMIELQNCLQTLRNLNPRKFKEQMSDVQMWLSGAMNDEDTCIQGINEGGGQAILGGVERKVTNSSRLTSNALAFAYKLAHTGFPHH